MTAAGLAPAALALAAAILAAPRPGRLRIDPHGSHGPHRPRHPAAVITGIGAGGTGVMGTAVMGTAVMGTVAMGTAACLASPTVAVAVLVVGATVVLRRRRHRRDQATREEARRLAGALAALAGELRTGAHPVRALENAAADCAPSPVATALHGVAARARLGADVAGGFRAVAEARGGSAQAPLWDRLAVYWQLGEDSGLPVAKLMSAAQHDITERRRFSERVHAAMAGSRTSALLLATLPALGVVLGELIGARPIAFLTGGGIGGATLIAGVTLIGAGLLWAERIARVPGA